MVAEIRSKSIISGQIKICIISFFKKTIDSYQSSVELRFSCTQRCYLSTHIVIMSSTEHLGTTRIPETAYGING